MDEWWEPPPLFEEGQVSNHNKQKINFLGYENELVSWGGPAIWSIQEKGTEIKFYWNRKYSHTHYPTRNPTRSLKPPWKNHLEKNFF